ncbi:MAG: exodeoxyribonuclease VII small subunit [Clostridia bacterium]|nr:exodeoxyribonuclease VII small subunit [Clostridia bacterium]
MENKLTFEKAMEELEVIVRKLESDTVSLDESIAMFDKGVKLSEYCNKLLDDATIKVNILNKDKDGNIVEEEFKGLENN